MLLAPNSHEFGYGYSISCELPNSGVIRAEAGGTVQLFGVLNNTGNTQILVASSGTFLVSGGRIAGGTVTGPAGSKLNFSTSPSNLLDGVTIDLDLDLTDVGDFVQIVNGLTLNGRATLGPEAVLFSIGTQTLGGTGEATPT